MSVEEIQDIVEEKLMASNRKDVARTYIRYRYKKELVRNARTNLDYEILGIKNGTSEETKNNANKDGKKLQTLKPREICCLDGEMCVIDHIVTDGLYDLINENGETAIHFMLSERDLDIAVFKGKNIDDMTETEAKTYINKLFDEYESQGFAKTFKGEEMLNGKEFEVIGRVGFPNEPDGVSELCMLPMWNIKFANGFICAAYPEEICLSERRL